MAIDPESQDVEAICTEEAEGFSIRDSKTANWLVRKIVEARAYREHVQEWAEAELRRSERQELFLLDRYGGQLEAWAREQIAKGHRRKSITLPAGTVAIRKEPPRLSVTNESALILWCRANLPDAIKVTQHVLRSCVMDHVRATGECPNGSEVGGGGEKLFIK